MCNVNNYKQHDDGGGDRYNDDEEAAELLRRLEQNDPDLLEIHAWY